jgi:hypothetical protein
VEDFVAWTEVGQIAAGEVSLATIWVVDDLDSL